MERDLYRAIRQIEDDHWWYVGRRSIIFDWVDRLTAGRTRPRVLDLGCGTGFNLDRLKAGGVDAVGADISEEAVRFCRERGLRMVVLADAAFPPFHDASFDV